MKNSIIRNKCVLLIAVAACIFTSCKKKEVFDFNGDESGRVFFNVENNTVKGYNSFAFSIVNRLTGTVGADITTSFPAKITQQASSDVSVAYGIDNSMIDAYNAVKGTNYIAIPDGMAVLGNALTIPKGELISSNPLQFSIPRDKMPLLTSPGYLVPLKITSVSGAENAVVSSNSSTVYVVITTTQNNELDRTNWTIQSFDSQESTGEGANNGRAVFLLDDNLSTFWTTQWSGNEPPLPHNVAVDMHAVKELSGLYTTGRQNAVNGSPRAIVVEVSTDAATWQSAGSFEVLAANTQQQLKFAQKYSVRYFRIIITATYGNTKSTFLSELSAY